MLTITFIRHGESEDNTKSIWAGWKDSPLSTLGQRQALALGQSLSTTRIDAIYSSPLLRAHQTGLAVQDAQPEPKPKITTNPNLREQHWGIAEGHPWTPDPPLHYSLQELYDRNIFPVDWSRDFKFPEGESLDDLARRSEIAAQEILVPLVKAQKEMHIAITSHGLMISEFVEALLRLDPDYAKDQTMTYAGLANTAWTRAVVAIKDGASSDANGIPPVSVKIIAKNAREHLMHLATETSLGEDNAKARAFFGGSSATNADTGTVASKI